MCGVGMFEDDLLKQGAAPFISKKSKNECESQEGNEIELLD